MNLHPGRNLPFPIVRFPPASGRAGFAATSRARGILKGRKRSSGRFSRLSPRRRSPAPLAFTSGLGLQRLRDKHRILDPGFLRRAAGHLSSGKNRLVLFSDEPDEAAEMLARVPAFGRFALEIDRGAPCESLRRMTAMEELVMSCSSFSWWGAWLGNTRKVIVPRDWFVGGVEDYRDIYLPHWVTL